MKTKKFIGGLLAGAAAGLAIGLLMDSDGGQEVKKKISKAAKNISNSFLSIVEDSLKSIKDRIYDTVDEKLTKEDQQENEEINSGSARVSVNLSDLKS